jgi:hypothetical protein
VVAAARHLEDAERRGHVQRRANAAAAREPDLVALFLGDLAHEECEGGACPSYELGVTCREHRRGSWRDWCWPCKAREVVDRGCA